SNLLSCRRHHSGRVMIEKFIWDLLRALEVNTTMDQVLQLALVTNDHFRSQDIAAVAKGFQWGFEAAVNQPQPLPWLRRQQPDVVLVDLDVPNAIGLMRDVVN